MRTAIGRAGCILGLLSLSLAAAAAPPFVQPVNPPAPPEARLLAALDTFRHGDLDSALLQVDSLIEAEPNFRLAQLVRGDLLATSSGAPLSFDATVLPRAGVDGLLAEARQRWKRLGFDPSGRIPEVLLTLSERQTYAVVVDLALSRLFLFRNNGGQPELTGDYYVSGGKGGARKRVKGDLRTPLGVYFVTERLPGRQLPDRYGPVAFPLDYPNSWDLRHGRTGSGIWLHGVASSTYSRPPLDSDGCVAMSNDEISGIAPLLEVGRTPMIIGENVNWLTAAEVQAKQSSVRDAMSRWEADWESRDPERYLAHYSHQFSGRGMDMAAWSDYKRKVNSAKRFIQVELDEVSLFAYPDEQNLVVATFRQSYNSDSFSSVSMKRQYWQRDPAERWLILSEETL